MTANSPANRAGFPSSFNGLPRPYLPPDPPEELCELDLSGSAKVQEIEHIPSLGNSSSQDQDRQYGKHDSAATKTNTKTNSNSNIEIVAMPDAELKTQNTKATEVSDAPIPEVVQVPVIIFSDSEVMACAPDSDNERSEPGAFYKPVVTHATYDELQLPFGYTANQNGIFYDKDGQPEWLCSRIIVTARFRTARATGWGRVVALTNRDDVVIEMTVMDRDLHSAWSKVAGLLFDRGLRITSKAWGTAALKNLLTAWEPAVCKTSIHNLGWVGAEHKAFVLGRGRVLGSGDIVLIEEISQHVAAEIYERGSLEDWTERVAKICVGNPILTLAVSQAFVGPLLGLLGLDMGGGLHFRGGPSKGKSTAMMAANSVWGTPSLMSTWRATANGLEARAATHSGLLLVLDEVGQIDPRQLDQAVNMLANGVGKPRSGRYEDLEQSLRWSLSLLSTGEVSIDERLLKAGGRSMAGQEVRLVDVVADGQRHGAFDELHGSPDSATFSGRLKATTGEVFGVAGPAFVKKLIDLDDDGRMSIRAEFEAAVAYMKIAAGVSLDGRSMRVAERFALNAVAGALATTMGLTGWDMSLALNAAKAAFLSWLDHQERDHGEDVERCQVQIREFMSHPDTVIHDIGDRTADALFPPHAWIQGDAVYFPVESWQVMFPGDMGNRVARQLSEAGVLVPGEGKNLMKKAPRSIPARPRVYTLNLQRLGISTVTASCPASNTGSTFVTKAG